MACKNCSPVEVQSKLSIKKFGEHMVASVQSIQNMLKEDQRYKLRLARAPEIQSQYDNFKEKLRCEVSEFISLFENAYYSKLTVHHPQVADTLNKFRMSLLKNKVLQDL